MASSFLLRPLLLAVSLFLFPCSFPVLFCQCPGELIPLNICYAATSANGFQFCLCNTPPKVGEFLLGGLDECIESLLVVLLPSCWRDGREPASRRYFVNGRGSAEDLRRKRRLLGLPQAFAFHLGQARGCRDLAVNGIDRRLETQLLRSLEILLSFGACEGSVQLGLLEFEDLALAFLEELLGLLAGLLRRPFARHNEFLREAQFTIESLVSLLL